MLLNDIALDSALSNNFKLSFDARYKYCYFDKNNDDIEDLIHILLFKTWNMSKTGTGKCEI